MLCRCAWDFLDFSHVLLHTGDMSRIRGSDTFHSSASPTCFIWLPTVALWGGGGCHHSVYLLWLFCCAGSYPQGRTEARVGWKARPWLCSQLTWRNCWCEASGRRGWDSLDGLIGPYPRVYRPWKCWEGLFKPSCSGAKKEVGKAQCLQEGLGEQPNRRREDTQEVHPKPPFLHFWGPGDLDAKT